MKGKYLVLWVKRGIEVVHSVRFDSKRKAKKYLTQSNKQGYDARLVKEI